MAEYDRQEFERMQLEAAARAREMHNRSRLSIPADIPPMPSFVRTPYSNQRNTPSNTPARGSKSEVSHVPEKRPEKKPSGRKGFDFLKMLNIKNLDIDSDRALVLLIFILLSSDGCDELLLLALLYIIL